MIDRDTYHWIHFYITQQKLSAGQTASKLGISESTVRRHLLQTGYEGRKEREIPSVLDGFEQIIGKMLSEHPYTSSQVFQRLKENGYSGSYSTLKRHVSRVRPPVKKAFFKLHFSPGEAAQADFGSCGTIRCENTERRLSVFVMELCHSRYLFAEFIPLERGEHFLSCHYSAFLDFGGVPERVIVDNCKCAVLECGRHGTAAVYNPFYLDFASRCGFMPSACNPGSPNEKGIVENAVRYIKHNFMTGRKFGSLEEANCALRVWLKEVANVRLHKATGRAPAELLQEERGALGALPAVAPDCAVTRHCRADSLCRVWFDSNSYSVPSRCASQALTVRACPGRIAVCQNGSQVASHVRSYGRKLDIVDPDHQQELRKVRRKAAQQNLIRDFIGIGADAEKFMAELNLRELNADLHMRRILTLCEKYGREAVAEVMKDMVQFQVFRAEYIENRLQTAGRIRPAGGRLHVPRAGDMLDIELAQPDLSIYEQEKGEQE